MISCILLGIILLTATVVSFPLYRKAAYDRMLQDEFENALRDSGEWPAKLEMTLVSKQQKGGKSMTQMEGYLANLFNQIGATPKVSGYYYRLDSQELKSAWNRGDMGKAYTRLGMLNGLPEHVTMVYGSMYSEDGLDEDGNIEQTEIVGIHIKKPLRITQPPWGKPAWFCAISSAEINTTVVS